MKNKIILASVIISTCLSNLNMVYAKAFNSEKCDISAIEQSLEINDENIPVYSVDEFFKAPESIGYILTKDGKSLIYGATWENRRNIFKKDIKTGEVTQITRVTDRDIANYFVKDDIILYMKDFGGDENFHIFKTDSNGNEVDLTPYENTRVLPLDLLTKADVKNEILIQMNLDNKEIFSVYRLNVLNGKTEKVLDNTAGYAGFLTDNEGKLRIAYYSDGVDSGYFYRETEEDEFKLVKMYDFHTNLVIGMFAEDNKTAYAISNIGRDKSALVKFDLETGEEIEVIFENNEVDITSISEGKKTGTLGAAIYYTDKMNIEFFDYGLENIYKSAQGALNTTELISLNYIDDNFKRAIAVSFSDVNKGQYYLFDIETGDIEKLGDTNNIKQEHLSEMIPISYEARDGKTIHGYLTIPKNTAPKNLPVIINPHGGPWARDFWGYNEEVQFLANRGYAVLQMNFRGSTGYGTEFLEAGYKQWGLDMQNDITDGVNWLISTGIADPDRIGIYGGSYGGYATLAGITFTPDLYAAAVDYVGVSNLFTFLETMPPYWESAREMMYEMVGNPEKDKEQFLKTSPALNADKIKTPLFIAQGANDPRVNKAESDQMVEALRSNGVEVEYMVKDNEGHGFSNYENRVDFYKAMEVFFNEYLND